MADYPNNLLVPADGRRPSSDLPCTTQPSTAAIPTERSLSRQAVPQAPASHPASDWYTPGHRSDHPRQQAQYSGTLAPSFFSTLAAAGTPTSTLFSAGDHLKMERDDSNSNTKDNNAYDSNSNGPPPTPSHHSGGPSQHPSPDTMLEAMTPHPGTTSGEPSPHVSNEPEILGLHTPLMTQLEGVACWHSVPDSAAPAQEEYDHGVIPDHKFSLYPSTPLDPSTLALVDFQTGEASGAADGGATDIGYGSRAGDFAVAFNPVDPSWPAAAPSLPPSQRAPDPYGVDWQAFTQGILASSQDQTPVMPAVRKHNYSALHHQHQGQQLDAFGLSPGVILYQPRQAMSSTLAPVASSPTYPAAPNPSVDAPALFANSPTPGLDYSLPSTPTFNQSNCVTPRTHFQRVRVGGHMGAYPVLSGRSSSHRFASSSNLAAGDSFADQPQQYGQQQLSRALGGRTPTTLLNPHPGSGCPLPRGDDSPLGFLAGPSHGGSGFPEQYGTGDGSAFVGRPQQQQEHQRQPRAADPLNMQTRGAGGGSEAQEITDASATQRQDPSRQSGTQGESAKPNMPYAKLIFECFKDNDFRPMELQKIYDWFNKNTTKRQEDLGGTNGWMNSIRHNLSMNRAFTKVKPGDSGSSQDASGDGTTDARRKKKGASAREDKKLAIWYLEPWAVKAGRVLPTTRDRNKGRGKGGSRISRQQQQQQQRQQQQYHLASSPSPTHHQLTAGPSSSIASQLRGHGQNQPFHLQHQYHHHHHPTSFFPPHRSDGGSVGYGGPRGVAGLSTPLAHHELHYQPSHDGHPGVPGRGTGPELVHIGGPNLQASIHQHQQQQQHLLPAAPSASHLIGRQEQHYYDYLEQERRLQEQRDRLALQQTPLQAPGGGQQIGARYHVGDYQQPDAPAVLPPASTSGSSYGVMSPMAAAPASLPTNLVSGIGPAVKAAASPSPSPVTRMAAFANALLPSNAGTQQQQQQQQSSTPIKTESAPATMSPQQQQQQPSTPTIKTESSPAAMSPQQPKQHAADTDADADADADGDMDDDVALLLQQQQQQGADRPADGLVPIASGPTRPGSPLAKATHQRRRSHPGL